MENIDIEKLAESFFNLFFKKIDIDDFVVVFGEKFELFLTNNLNTIIQEFLERTGIDLEKMFQKYVNNNLDTIIEYILQGVDIENVFKKYLVPKTYPTVVFDHMMKEIIIKIVERLIELEKEYFEEAQRETNLFNKNILNGKSDGIGKALTVIDTFFTGFKEIHKLIDDSRK